MKHYALLLLPLLALSSCALNKYGMPSWIPLVEAEREEEARKEEEEARKERAERAEKQRRLAEERAAKNKAEGIAAITDDQLRRGTEAVNKAWPNFVKWWNFAVATKDAWRAKWLDEDFVPDSSDGWWQEYKRAEVANSELDRFQPIMERFQIMRSTQWSQQYRAQALWELVNDYGDLLAQILGFEFEL